MYRLINCFILILVLNFIQSNNGMSPVTKPIATPHDPPEPQFAQCKLKSSDLKDLLQKGEKGEQGLKGEPGEKGPSGLAGLAGLQGVKGDKGDKAEKGDQGMKGDKGDKGDIGDKGADGRHGDKGDKGSTGSSGTCTYNPDDDISSDVTDGIVGTKEKPLKNVCKYEGKVVEASVHYIQPKGCKMFEVHCENKIETCLLPKTATDFEINDNKPFWLSNSPGWTIEGIYGLTSDQLQWLQRRSGSAKQIIKYHCLNSVPISNDESKTLKLLTWNDIIIGNKPSLTTPFHYDVITDFCKDSAENKTVWNHTQISMNSPVSTRLPVLDIQINDVRGEEQKIKIEHVKLCFQ